ncbi:MAG: spirocyclase AveC family protein [Solirubrobacteraceae bacterium]
MSDTLSAPGVGAKAVVHKRDAARVQPVTVWAGLGTITLAFIAFVLIKWVTGPWFRTVPSGPSVPPTWMKAALIFWQAFAVVGTFGLLYVLLIRPWRRERQIPLDGLLVGAFFLCAFQDPLSSIFGDWFSWNAYLLNKGSWIYSIPGSNAYGRPGAAVVEPILGGFIWVWIAFAGAWAGCWVLRRARTRWPELGPVPLITLILFPAMMVFDFVLEGLVAIPTGLYVYSGGHLSLFPDAYNKYPLHEAVFAGATLSGLAALRFFKNDRGETVVERGAHRLRTGPLQKALIRFLALVFMTQLIPFVTYNLPSGLVAGEHSATWPRAIQSLSYFTAHLCGAGTDVTCPRDGVPLTAGVHGPAARFSPVPFSSAEPSPFQGRLLGNSR